MDTENNGNLNSSTCIDRLSFQAGMINCFVEMVACGVKKLALSPPLTPDEYEKIKPWSKKLLTGLGCHRGLKRT